MAMFSTVPTRHFPFLINIIIVVIMIFLTAKLFVMISVVMGGPILCLSCLPFIPCTVVTAPCTEVERPKDFCAPDDFPGDDVLCKLCLGAIPTLFAKR